MLRRRRSWTGVLVLVGLAAAACSGSADQGPTGANTPTARPTVAQRGKPVGAECLNASERQQVIHFDSPAGVRLAGVEIGDGSIGVVLAHQSSGNLCEWWPYARILARRHRVLAFDFEGFGASQVGSLRHPGYAGDVRAAAGWLRAHGTRRVVLMGASMGGTAVIVAASRMRLPPAGVIDLSGPASFSGMNAAKAAPRLRCPVLFATGKQDPYAGDVVQVRRATGSSFTPLVTVPGRTHGTSLVDPNLGYAKVRTAVNDFLIRAAGSSAPH